MSMKENRKTTSNWVKRNLRRLIRRNYVRWATVIAKYPFCLIFISVVFTLTCCLSFYFKTPYSIHSLSSVNFSENKPEGYILQFEFENKHPTRKLIEETTKVIRNHEYLSNNCVHGESLKSGIPPDLSKVIPNHSCLIFSPANLPDSDHEFPRNIEELFKRHKKAARILWGSKWKHYPPVVTVVLRHDIDPQAPWLLTLARDLFPASASENVSTPPRSGTEPLININFHFGYPATIDWLVYLSAGILLYVYYYVTVRKMNFLESSIITSAAVCGTLIMSLMVALGSCLALDLDIYVESGPFERGIGWIFIYYTFTFIAFESVLMLTKCIIETPVEEGPTERIAHGLLRGGCHLSKFFFAQLALTMIGSISEYSRSFSIFALIMVLSHSALLHSFFAPILFLELKQLERSEPKWIHKRSGAAIRLRRYWNSRNSGKFGEDTLEDVTPLVDLGENHIDPIEGMFQPLRIKLLKTWAHKAILQKITMIVFITWIGYRVFMVDPSEINNDYDDNDLEFAKLPWAYAFQLYSRDIRGKHLSFLPRIRVPFDPSGSRPIPIYQETKDSPRLTQFVSWKLVSLIIAFAAAIYKLYKAYERKIEINKSFVEYFDSGKSSKSLFEDVALGKHLELEFTIDHVAQDVETGNLLLVDSSGSLTIFDASSNKIVSQKLSQISSYRASTTSDSRHHFTEDDNPLISDDETVWSIGIHQNNIILGLSSGNVKFLQVSKAEMLLKSTYLLDESGVSFIITRDEESAFIALTIEGTVRKFSTCPFSAHEVQQSTPGVTVVRTMCERIVSGSLDGSVTVLNKDCRTDHVCKGHNYPITALNLFKNGKSSSDITAMSADQSGQVRIWTLLSGRCQFVLGNYCGMISNVWPCRDILIGMTQSGRVLIWTHRSGHFKQSFKLGESSNGGAIVLNENLLIAAFDQQIGFIDLDLKNKKKINLAAKFSIRENNFKIRSTALTPSKLFFSQTGDRKTLFFSHGRTLKSLLLPPHVDCTNIS